MNIFILWIILLILSAIIVNYRTTWYTVLIFILLLAIVLNSIMKQFL